MHAVKTVQRQEFEEDAFPHLEALWRTTLWLTMRGNLADDLVVRTMKRAYREWHDSRGLIGAKARLFRTLAREFFSGGKRWLQLPQPMQSPANSVRTTESPHETNPQDTMPENQYGQRQRLSGAPDASVKEVVALLEPYSRFLMALRFGERLSYADIAYIIDLREASVKVMLIRLRRQIPQLLARHAGLPVAPANNSKLLPLSVSLDPQMEINPHERTGTVGCISSTDSERWENEGGATLSRLEGDRLCASSP